jgi:hypothetical protein
VQQVERARARQGGDVIVLAVGLIASTCAYSTVARWFNLTAVAVAVPAVLAVVASGRVDAPRWWSIAAAAAMTLVPQLAKPQTGEVHRRAALPVAVTCAFVACLLLIIAVTPPLRRHARLLVLAVLAVAAVGLVLEIVGAARPIIDVWEIFQQASAGLFHGRNPYDYTYQHIPPGQTAGCYNYLPTTLLVSWVGWVTLDDVRYAELAVLAAGWVTVGLAVRRSTRPTAREGRATSRIPVATLALAVVLVGGMRVVQQSWNESIALGFLLLAAGLIALDRRNWAVVALGAALCTKQHIVLVLPLFALWPVFGWRRALAAAGVAVAIGLPWLVWNPARFSHCTVQFFIDLPARHDSLSLWKSVPEPLRAPVVVTLAAAALAVAAMRLPRTAGGLLVGSGAVLAAFDYANKQTFQNQWWIAAELLLCGVALRAAETEPLTTGSAARVRYAEAAGGIHGRRQASQKAT